jgi:hypothetical protein
MFGKLIKSCIVARITLPFSLFFVYNTDDIVQTNTQYGGMLT